MLYATDTIFHPMICFKDLFCYMYIWCYMSSPNPYIEALTLQRDGIWRWDLRRSLGLDGVMTVGLP